MLANSKFTNLDLISKFFIKRGSRSKENCVDFILAEYSENNLNIISESEKETVKANVKKLKSKFDVLFKKNQYKLDRLIKNNGSFAFNNFKLPLRLVNLAPSTSKASCGRPIKEFQYKSKKSQQKEVRQLFIAGKKDPFKLLLAAHKAAKEKKLDDLAAAIKYILSSHEKASTVMNLIRNQKPIIKKTPEESLSIILDNSLSKRQYINISQCVRASNCDIFPSYPLVAKAKLICRPVGGIFTDTCAEVPMENILEHTLKRILTYQKDVINCTYRTEKLINLIFICSWGMDGSSGFSNYNQKWLDNADHEDSSLFVTTLNPLQLYDEKNPDHIVWRNNSPQSIRFCRPVCMKFQAESTELIKREKERFDNQIANLKSLEYLTENGTLVKIKYNLIFSLIDGKVLSAVTDTASSQICPICKHGPKEFNDLGRYKDKLFVPLTENLSYGIQPLHMWIRCLEFCLHLSYRIDFKKWQARGEHKEELLRRKEFIKKEMWGKMGLKVDQPRPGGKGTSNTGNTARTAFARAEEFSSILGLEVELINRLRTILIAISCQFPIDAEQFSIYCNDTAEYIVRNYGWFKMPVSIHKVLAHGSDISSYLPLPLGVLGEECAEARNKYYKKDREHHARKCNRTFNLHDVFCRAMDSSDPVISSIGSRERMQRRKKTRLPKDVIALLDNPQQFSTEISEDMEDEISLEDDNFSHIIELENIEF